MHRRVSCPLMIGRERDLGRLNDALALAQAGEPTAVLVGGEAGIGKTRLVDEFVAALPDGVRVLRGGCVPLTGGLLPYAPVAEVMRGIARSMPAADLVELTGPDLPVLAAFLPELADGPEPPSPHGIDQYRLFAALRRLLERLARDTTFVVLLEDLHWADPSTRALVAYLVHGMRTGIGHQLLVATYRTDELHRRHPLPALLAELDRGGVGRVELSRLGFAETAAQIAGVLHGDADDGLARRVYERSGGNPFLVEELLAASDGAVLPEGTRDILLRRVRRLPAANQRLLLAVAVAGRRAGEGLLTDVVGPSPELVLERLRAAVDEHILVVVEDGYAFRHALVAEALLAEALPGERTALHRAYAEALARRWDDGGEPNRDAGSPAQAAAAAEMAHHWCQAGEPVRGLRASVRAGLAAEAVFAHAEARAHFDRAIELWHQAPQARASTDLDVVELCRHGAEAAYLEGDTDHAIGLVRRAMGQVDDATDPLRAGMLHERLGRYLWANGDAESESIGAYQRAVDLVPDAPTAERARVLTGLASAFTYADRPDPSACCAEALRVARAAGARGEEGRALQSLGYCRAMAGDIRSGVDHCRQALTIAAELGQSDEHYRAYVALVATLRIAGRTAEAYTTAMEGVDLARRRGAERTYGNLLLGDAVELLLLLGRWDEADELLPDEPDVQAHGTPVVATNLWLSAANLHTWRGRFDRSQRFLDACMAAYATHGHGHVRSMLHANLSELCLWQGQYGEASRWIRRELDLLGTIDFTSLLARLVLQGLRAEAGLARHIDLPRLAALVDDVAGRPDPPPDAAALIVMCRAELARVRGQADPELWAEAADHLTKLDMPWPLAFSRWRQAEALLAGRPSGQRRQAGALALSDAHAVAAKLGAEPLRRDIAALARRARLMSVITPTHRRAADGASRDLTDREREVLELLCEGATNRRIAHQLFISEKTVSIHVSRILTKLHAANRGEAAAIAHRSGLVRV